MEKKGGDILFVEVNNPQEVRRDVLEPLKDIVEGLERFEKFKEVRANKVKIINNLRKNIKGISKLVSNLKSSLPKTNIKAVKAIEHRLPEKKKIPVVEKKEIPQEEPKPQSVTELQKLEAELKEIENKLGALR
ncbi:hypothetical protein KY347_00560 [Candidatus Woesearchaeota archaeon]|nr:hypothetical protein [Candidatus Woesearchaeota archaeon]